MIRISCPNTRIPPFASRSCLSRVSAHGRQQWLMAVLLCLVLLGLLLAPLSQAAPPGMMVKATSHDFATLVTRLEQAIEDHDMGLVTRASASKGAANRGVTIPGNMVIGVYRNDFAVRMLNASVPAGIEAPIRFYLTENDDGTTTLSYRRPSAVFAPFESAELDAMATELDAIFAAIADQAVAD